MFGLVPVIVKVQGPGLDQMGVHTACRKFGNGKFKETDNLAVQGRVLEVASPPQQQVRLTFTEINPFAIQDKAKSQEVSNNECDVRKDMIGSRQEIQARPGLKTNQESPTTGLGGGQSMGVSGNTGAGNWLQTSK